MVYNFKIFYRIEEYPTDSQYASNDKILKTEYVVLFWFVLNPGIVLYNSEMLVIINWLLGDDEGRK